MQSYNVLDVWMETLVYFDPIDRQPQNKLVRLSPLAVGFIVGWVFWAITAIVVFPLFIAAVGMMLVSDAIAVSLENFYRAIKRWILRIWCRIFGNRKNSTKYQLPTTNTPQTNVATKESPLSSLAPSVFIDTKNDEREFALHSNPVTTMKYTPSNSTPVFPSPCAEIGGRSRERNSQATVFPSPPPPYS
ncbi:hypothetical protein BPOR_0016g00270 [Botrytis porri]|uniref:Uncharacterized protein n=1 Tax=Botrytis porri TaxID=87229 RepID=A0A4Z1L4X7_9HELO|nr:hypothetical protein BPOR_0016g00270 [Botrytis porri]